MEKNKRNKKHIYKVGEVVNSELEIIKKSRNKFNHKSYIVKSLVYPDAPYYNIDESSIKKGTGCAYKNNKRIYEGNSLYSVEWIRPYIVDIEEAKKTSPKTSRKIKMQCPVCKQKKNIAPGTVHDYGFSCKYCSKNISYPEQFFIAYTNIKKLPFKHQQKLPKSKRVFDSVNYTERLIVELHGIQHYDSNNKWYDRSKESDEEKREYAEENNWTLIELDCSKSSFEYIRNSISNCSYLPNIKKEEESKIINAINHNKNLPMREIINLYINEEKSSYEIASILNVHQSTIIRALSKNNVSLRDSHEISSKKVRCINTGEIFISISEAQRYYNTRNISNVCNGKRKSSGTLNGNPLKWEFVEQ